MTKCNITLDFFKSIVAFPKISSLRKSGNCSFIKIKLHVKNLKIHSARARRQRLTIASPHRRSNLKIIFFIGAHIYRVVIGKFIEDLMRSPTQLQSIYYNGLINDKNIRTVLLSYCRQHSVRDTTNKTSHVFQWAYCNLRNFAEISLKF